MCNFIPDVAEQKKVAIAHGFSGIDWTFKPEDFSENGAAESLLLRQIACLHPLEVRYHCAFNGVDIGDADTAKADAAMELYRRVCGTVAKLNGRFMTIHMGLGRDSSDELCWDRSVEALAELVKCAADLGVCVCLENLASGWSSRPELFEKLIRKSNAGITLDIGHARVSPSVQTQHYDFEDFISPHHERIFNAHIYHEERDNGHLPPKGLEDMLDRLSLLTSLPCDWWVLELRQEAALLSTLRVVRQFMDSNPKS